jgi:hypothetical protein
MTEEILLLVRELKLKIHLVFDEYEELEKGNEVLRQEIISLKKRVEVLENEKGQIGVRYENLKLAKVIEAGYSDNLSARQKINTLLREIDKCVALLNG